VNIRDRAVSFDRLARLPAGQHAGVAVEIVEADGSKLLEPDLGAAIDQAWWNSLYRGAIPDPLAWPLVINYREFWRRRDTTTCNLGIDWVGKRIGWRLVDDQRLVN
jgi:hypothetical protein